MFGKKKQDENKGYTFKPRDFDRDERIALQKIVSGTPVTRKLLPQEKLVKLIYSYVARNIRIGSTAAQNVNTTKHPQVFFKSLKDLFVTTENLVEIEKYWRFEGRGPTEQLEDLVARKDAIIKGFLNESFNELIINMEKKSSTAQKQKMFDDYQQSLINNKEILGEENFEFFKELCMKKLNVVTEEESD
ncbi:MAG: hypothetical protein IKC01_02040 [Clostridia bacterium]|nr:hypothetical protein [Clostridia bacterium]